MLNEFDLGGRVLDITPTHRHANARRDEEILEWLNGPHPMRVQIKKFIAIDDDTFDLTAVKHVLVHTDGTKGLQDKHVEQAIQLLS